MATMMIKETQIYYESKGSGKPLILIHGAYLSREEWIHQLSFAEKGYQVICVDLPGHGKSGKLPFYSVELMADYVTELMDKLNLVPCIVCGHSLGGMVAQALAAAHPVYIEKLILAETSFGVKSNALEALMTALSMPILKRVSVEKQTALFASQMGRQSEATKAYVAREIIKHADDHDNYNRIWDATVNYDGKLDISNIAAPTLILAGRQNKQTHRQAKVMQVLIPNSELAFIDNAGHMVNMDAPSKFNEAVLRFIKE